MAETTAAPTVRAASVPHPLVTAVAGDWLVSRTDAPLIGLTRGRQSLFVDAMRDGLGVRFVTDRGARVTFPFLVAVNAAHAGQRGRTRLRPTWRRNTGDGKGHTRRYSFDRRLDRRRILDVTIFLADIPSFDNWIESAKWPPADLSGFRKLHGIPDPEETDAHD